MTLNTTLSHSKVNKFISLFYSICIVCQSNKDLTGVGTYFSLHHIVIIIDINYPMTLSTEAYTFVKVFVSGLAVIDYKNIRNMFLQVTLSFHIFMLFKPLLAFSLLSIFI